MTLDEVVLLIEFYSFPLSVQIRVLEEDEAIASTLPNEVAFYEAAFHDGLCLPLHLVIIRILYFCPACPQCLAKPCLCIGGVARP